MCHKIADRNVVVRLIFFKCFRYFNLFSAFRTRHNLSPHQTNHLHPVTANRAFSRKCLMWYVFCKVGVGVWCHGCTLGFGATFSHRHSKSTAYRFSIISISTWKLVVEQSGVFNPISVILRQTYGATLVRLYQLAHVVILFSCCDGDNI
mgnify:CR=1 FL=1